MKTKRSITLRLATMALAVLVLATAAPAMAAVINEAPTDPIGAKFASSLDPKPAAAVKIERVLIVEAPEPTEDAAQRATSAVRVESAPAEVPAQVTDASTMAQAPVVQAAPKPAATSSTPVSRTGAAGGDELAQAKAILASYIAKYPILQGTTVSIGTTPGGHQAVAYYQSGRILISSSHTVSLERILAHEIWHVIDWRDNGQIDWGENIPPK